MIAKRIIPCFDVRDGRVMKFESFFENERDVGDPLVLAQRYEQEGADELVLLDISATIEGRQTTLSVVREVAAHIHIPLTVGGGIADVDSARMALRAGADKVSINSAAVRRPALIGELAHRFGAQCVVVAIDARRDQGNPSSRAHVMIDGGRTQVGWNAVDWAIRAARLGAGELLLTSFDQDGRGKGYDVELTREIAHAVPIPVIASGGAGTVEHLYDVLTRGGAEAALAATMFHLAGTSIQEVKATLARRGLVVRPLDANSTTALRT